MSLEHAGGRIAIAILYVYSPRLFNRQVPASLSFDTDKFEKENKVDTVDRIKSHVHIHVSKESSVIY
jgi:hypothetical protein